MKLSTNEKGDIVLEEVFSGIILKTSDNEVMGICMRDSGFEFSYNNEMYYAQKGKVYKPSVLEPIKKQSLNTLYNIDIINGYKDYVGYFHVSEFVSAFAYWTTSQIGDINEKTMPYIISAIKSFEDYVKKYWKNNLTPEKLSYKEIDIIVSEENLEKIPEVLALNEAEIVGDKNWIDLGALSRNIFFMLLREQITQPL